jgi:hypothetical protein
MCRGGNRLGIWVGFCLAWWAKAFDAILMALAELSFDENFVVTVEEGSMISFALQRGF